MKKSLFLLFLAVLFVGKSTQAQEILSIEPDSAMQGHWLSITVTISGQNTSFSQASNTVRFTQGTSTVYYPESHSVTDDITIRAEINMSFWYDTGLYDVVVENELDSSMVLEEAFRLLPGTDPPRINFDPYFARRGESVSATVYGHNTFFSKDLISFYLLQDSLAIYPLTFEVYNDTMIYAGFEFSHEHELGYYDLQMETEKFGLLSWEDAFDLRESNYPPSSITINPDTAVFGTNFYMTLHSEYKIFQACDSICLQGADGSKFHPWSISHLSLELAELYFKYESGMDTGYYDLLIKCDDDNIDIRLDDAVYLMDYSSMASLDTAYSSHCQQGWEAVIDVCGEYTRFISEVEAWLSQDGIDIFHAESTSFEPDSNCLTIRFDFPRDIPAGIYDLNTYDDNHGHLILPDAVEILPGETYYLPQPIGTNLICEGMVSSEYYIPMDDEFSDYQWSLDPDTAGSITAGTGNSCMISWDESYTGTSVLTASAIGQFDSLFYSEPLEITIKEKPVLSFDYFSSGMKYTFINTSTGGLVFEWSFGDGSTATSFNASHTFTEYGLYTVELTLNDEVCGLFAVSDTVNVVTDDVTNSFQNNYKLYPNPSAGIFTLERNSFYQDHQQIWVTDLQGRIILKDIFEPGKHSIRLSLEDVSPGLYILNVRKGHVLWKEQIMILKQ